MILLLAMSGGVAAVTVVWIAVWRLHGTLRSFPAHPARAVTIGDRCPACHAGTVRRTAGQYGQFLGCSQYDHGRGCAAAWNVSGTLRIRRQTPDGSDRPAARAEPQGPSGR